MEVDLQEDRTIPETERQALVLARRGQGQFRANVLAIDKTRPDAALVFAAGRAR